MGFFHVVPKNNSLDRGYDASPKTTLLYPSLFNTCQYSIQKHGLIPNTFLKRHLEMYLVLTFVFKQKTSF